MGCVNQNRCRGDAGFIFDPLAGCLDQRPSDQQRVDADHRDALLAVIQHRRTDFAGIV